MRPWREVKSRRGRKKEVDTEGYACPTETCDYAGITDSEVHALVGYGGHGKQEWIQDLYCEACDTKFSARRGTPLYRLKTPVKRVGEVLAALAEGLDVAAAVRVFGHGEGTIHRWLTRAGVHSEQVHRHFFRDLLFGHVQLDELKTRWRERAKRYGYEWRWM